MSYSGTIENALKYSAKIESPEIQGVNINKYSGALEILESADINFNLCDHLGRTITDQTNNMVLCLTERLRLLYSAIIEILKK